MNAAVLQPHLELRPMQEDDVVAVCEVEQASYEFPWSDGIFRDCLRVGYACWVLHEDDALIGYSVLSAGAGEAHILNLCVAGSERGSGHGRRLLAHLVGLADEYGAAQIFLEVRPSNHGAIALYRTAGFHEVGRRPSYYPAHHGREDALVLRLAIDADGAERLV